MSASEDAFYFRTLDRIEPIHDDAHVVRVDPVGELRRKTREVGTVSLIEHEVIEGHDRTTLIHCWSPMRSDADPVNLPCKPLKPRLRAMAPDTDHSFEAPGTYLSHAAADPKPAEQIWISVMGSFVDERAHRLGR